MRFTFATLSSSDLILHTYSAMSSNVCLYPVSHEPANEFGVVQSSIDAGKKSVQPQWKKMRCEIVKEVSFSKYFDGYFSRTVSLK